MIRIMADEKGLIRGCCLSLVDRPAVRHANRAGQPGQAVARKTPSFHVAGLEATAGQFGGGPGAAGADGWGLGAGARLGGLAQCAPQRHSQATPSQLEQWADRLLEAPSLVPLFADGAP